MSFQEEQISPFGFLADPSSPSAIGAAEDSLAEGPPLTEQHLPDGRPTGGGPRGRHRQGSPQPTTARGNVQALVN